MTTILQQTVTCGLLPARITRLEFPRINQSASLWLLDLAQPRIDAEFDILSAQEWAYANRFVQDLHRHRYIAAHCALRTILSKTIGHPASRLEFAHGPHGKPYLPNHPGCVFNLSHSGDWGVVAIGTAPDVQHIGVDIEVMRTIDNLDELAKEAFTPAEQDELQQTPETQKAEAFLHGWVRKESVLKAMGTGLSLPPRQVHAGLGANPVKVIVLAGDRRYSVDLYSMQHPAGFSVAVALM